MCIVNNFLDSPSMLKYNDSWKIKYSKIRFFYKNKPFDLDKHSANLNRAEQIKKDNLPKLYKYCRFDKNNYALENLFKSRVYLNNPNKFNDPFDSVYNFNIDSNILLNEALNSIKVNNNDYEKIKQELINNKEEILDNVDKIISKHVKDNNNSYRNKTWVTCFSERYNSILMWSHYADSHKGFCIEYDFSNEKELSCLLSPVLYIDQTYDIREHDFNGEGLEFCTLLKSIEWNYEKEWRITICNLENARNEFLTICKPTAIFLGACIKDDNRKLLIDFARKNNIKVYQMEMSLKDYKLIHKLI